MVRRCPVGVMTDGPGRRQLPHTLEPEPRVFAPRLVGRPNERRDRETPGAITNEPAGKSTPSALKAFSTIFIGTFFSL